MAGCWTAATVRAAAERGERGERAAGRHARRRRHLHWLQDPRARLKLRRALAAVVSLFLTCTAVACTATLLWFVCGYRCALIRKRHAPRRALTPRSSQPGVLRWWQRLRGRPGPAVHGGHHAAGPAGGRGCFQSARGALCSLPLDLRRHHALRRSRRLRGAHALQRQHPLLLRLDVRLLPLLPLCAGPADAPGCAGSPCTCRSRAWCGAAASCTRPA